MIHFLSIVALCWFLLELAAKCFLVCLGGHKFGFNSNSQSSSNPKQFTGTSSGSSTGTVGDSNSVGNTTTTAINNSRTESTNTVGSNNSTSVNSGGTVNNTTNSYGLTPAEVQSLSSVFSGGGGGSGGGTSGGGITIGNTPTPGVVTTLANSSNLKWGIAAGALFLIALLWALLKRK